MPAPQLTLIHSELAACHRQLPNMTQIPLKGSHHYGSSLALSRPRSEAPFATALLHKSLALKQKQNLGLKCSSVVEHVTTTWFIPTLTSVSAPHLKV